MQNKKVYSLKEATRKLENYCVYQDRCRKEVITKLSAMEMSPIGIDKIMNHLIKENFLNEERFVRSFVSGKFNLKKWGKNKIINELKKRDITKYNISTVLKDIDDEMYLNTLNLLAQKRLTQLNETNIFKKRKKLADYLLHRGWESSLVYEITEKLLP